MPAITRAEFRRALGRLSTAGFVAFVADLWAARGYDTDVDGTTVLVRAGGEPTTIRVCHDGSLLGRLRAALGARGVEDADLVVTSAPADRVDPGTDIEVIGAGDLHGMALYGIDRDACTTLFDDHLDRSPTVEQPGDPRFRLAGRGRTVAAVTVALVALVAAAAAGPLGAVQVGGTGGPGGTAIETIDTNASRTPPPTTETENSPLSGIPEPTAPLNPEAVDLATAHAAALENRSFRVVVNHTVSQNGTVIGYNKQDVSFGPNRILYSMTETQGGLQWADSRRDLWTNGREVVVRTTAANRTEYQVLREQNGVLRDRQGRPVGPRVTPPFDPVFVADLPGLLAAIESVEIRSAGPSAVALLGLGSMERTYARRRYIEQPEETPSTLGGVLNASPTRALAVFRFKAELSEDAVSKLDGSGEIENATLTGVVDSEGRFYRYTVGYDRTAGGESFRTARLVAFGEVGIADVGRPAWYDTALHESRSAVSDDSDRLTRPEA